MIEYEEAAVMVLEENLSPQELVDKLHQSINWMVFSESGFAQVLETRPTQTQDWFLLLAADWIVQLEEQYNNDQMDGRNESSVRFGHMLFSSKFFTVFLHDIHSRMEQGKLVGSKSFVELFGKEHFRIQDTFSGMVFSVFSSFTPKTTAEKEWQEYFLNI